MRKFSVIWQLLHSDILLSVRWSIQAFLESLHRLKASTLSLTRTHEYVFALVAHVSDWLDLCCKFSTERNVANNSQFLTSLSSLLAFIIIAWSRRGIMTWNNVAGQMGGYYNPYTSAGFSAAHMAAAAAAAAAQQTGQVNIQALIKQSKNISYIETNKHFWKIISSSISEGSFGL